jgi:pyruvate/2-oxoglutarate/acetoin dehydrogenase E1 component
LTSVLESLNTGLISAFEKDERVWLLGEDVLDPYGGAFKVTRGLSTRFPGRVLTTPISEAGIVGLAGGMALRGLRPVVEIMFGDFLTLCADQIINHLAKFRQMYNNQVDVPVVIRTPMGGRRGYGPTHSQTLEKHFLGAPGLKIVAPTTFGEAGSLLTQVILNTRDPVLFVENKILYTSRVLGDEDKVELAIQASGNIPLFTVRLAGAPAPVLTMAAYGYSAELARQAMLRLAYDYEIFSELIVYQQIAPFEMVDLNASLERSGRLLTIEEGGETLGWGAEIAALALATPARRNFVFRRLAARDVAIPASKALEAQVFPGVEDIVGTARDMVQKGS